MTNTDMEELSFFKQRRYHLTVMLFLGFFNLYSLRINLSVGIVAMTNGTKSGYEADFDWSSKEQGVVLSSFFYGYILTLFGGGVLASKIGGRRLFGGGVFFSAVLTLLTPWAAKTSIIFFVIVRALEGICGGICYPCLHAIWSKWAPPMERSRLNAIAFAGMYGGTVVMMPVSGILAENFGWRSVFYVTGSIACVWSVLWFIITSESPAVDKFISESERCYIVDSLKEVTHEPGEKPPTPFRAIFTSAPVWAICSANISGDWGFYTMITQLPTFLTQTLDLNLQTTGLISACPYIVLTSLTFPVSYVADWTRKNGYMTTTQVRKFCQCLALTGEATFMLMAAILAHPTYSVVCLICAVGFASFYTSGYCVNALDIAPQYASIIMGFSNTCGTFTGIITPILTGYIVQNGKSSEWNTVFAVSASVLITGCFVYFFFGSGELQEWAKLSPHKNDLEKSKPSEEKIIKEN